MQVLLDLRELHLFDLLGPGVFLHPIAGENLHIDDRAIHPGGHPL